MDSPRAAPRDAGAYSAECQPGQHPYDAGATCHPPGNLSPPPTARKRNRRMSNDMDAQKKLTKAVRDELECVVCMSSMHRTIYQCMNGHVVCGECKPKLQGMCATCRVPLGKTRNRALERIAACVNLPCRFCDAGCDEVLCGAERESHEKCCQFRPFHCPLNQSCTFHGNQQVCDPPPQYQ